MSVLSKLNSSGTGETAKHATRDAARSAASGARRGAKRGASLGAIRGTSEALAKRTGRKPQSPLERGRSRAAEAGESIEDAAKRAQKQIQRAAEAAQRSAAEITGRRRTPKKAKAAAAAGVGAAGAAGAYFLNPESGKRRRDIAREKVTSLARTAGAKLGREPEHPETQATGTAQQGAGTSGHGSADEPAKSENGQGERKATV
jgi:hypothetical protein